jgi:hypothetical protein
MSVVVRDSVMVDTNIFAKSKNMVVNTVMETLLEISYRRHLDPAALLDLRKKIEDAVYVWLHDRTLMGLMLEVSLPESANALENWEMVFFYKDDPNNEVKKAPTQEMKRFAESLKDLPPGSAYRLLVNLAPDAKMLEGWSRTTRKNIHPSIEKRFDNFGYGPISGQLLYTGGSL